MNIKNIVEQVKECDIKQVEDNLSIIQHDTGYLSSPLLMLAYN